MRRVLLLVTASAALAESPYDVLASARRTILADANSLPNYLCVQLLQRETFRRTRRWRDCAGATAGAPRPSISRQRASVDSHATDLSGSNLERWTSDRYRLDVRVSSDFREVYSWAGAKRFDAAEIDQIIGEGAVTSGSFGPFLLNIFGSHGVDFDEDGSETENGRKLLKFRYRVPLRSSRYDFKSAGVSHIIPYYGVVWIDAETADLVRLEVRATDMPRATGTCEAVTTIDFQRVEVAGRPRLLPRTSTMDALALTGEFINRSEFSACRGFSAESGIRFDLVESDTSGAAHAARHSDKLPRGIPLTLAFEAEIDSAVAAAGDLVRARLLADAVDKRTKKVLAQAGAVATGRIVRLEHQWVGNPHVLLAINWETLQSAATSIPFTAVVDTSEGSFTIRAADLGHGPAVRKPVDPSGGRALLLLTTESHYVVPRGYESKWVTR